MWKNRDNHWSKTEKRKAVIENLSKTHSGNTYRKGKKVEDTTKHKIASQKNWSDPEYRKKISKAHSHKLPKEWVENIAKGHKGLTKVGKKGIKSGFATFDYNGDKHWNWKGGITSENRRQRGTAKYIKWRQGVFDRDNYTCQNCGLKNGKGKTVYLEAHHIKSFALFKLLRFEINNGVTYCRKCHIELDKYRGVKL